VTPRTRAQHAESVRRYLATELAEIEKMDPLDPLRGAELEGLVRFVITELGWLSESIEFMESRHG
jgi:hypothetical protein